MLGDEATRALTNELYDRSGGNPLFLEELAELVGCGGEPLQLPDSLRALVAARLDELPVDQRAMLDNAAVLGSSGSYGALVEFGQALGQNVSRSVLDALADAGLAGGRGWVVAVPLGQRPRGRVPHHHQGRPGPPPRRRGQGDGRRGAQGRTARRAGPPLGDGGGAGRRARRAPPGRPPRRGRRGGAGAAGVGHPRRRPPLPPPGHRAGGTGALDRRLPARGVHASVAGADAGRRRGSSCGSSPRPRPTCRPSSTRPRRRAIAAAWPGLGPCGRRSPA